MAAARRLYEQVELDEWYEFEGDQQCAVEMTAVPVAVPPSASPGLFGF